MEIIKIVQNGIELDVIGSVDASSVTQDADNRFVTDTEKNTWNNKQDSLTAGTNITISADGKTISATDKDTITTINGKTGAITKADIVALGIPGQDTNTTYSPATTTTNGLMSSADKTKLNNIETGAQVNTVTSVNGQTGAVTVTKSDIGLGAVNNVAITQEQVTKVSELNYTKAMMQAQYDALSQAEKDRADVWYGIYEE